MRLMARLLADRRLGLGSKRLRQQRPHDLHHGLPALRRDRVPIFRLLEQVGLSTAGWMHGRLLRAGTILPVRSLRASRDGRVGREGAPCKVAASRRSNMWLLLAASSTPASKSAYRRSEQS